MGDKVTIEQIQYLEVQDIYQIDLYNETKKEYFRVFVDCDKLHLMLDTARAEV